MVIKVGDLLGVGLVLISIFIIALSLRETNTLIKLIGLVGGVIIIIVESTFLHQVWKKK